MSGTNRIIQSVNVLKGNSVMTSALENANEEAIKIEDEESKEKGSDSEKGEY